MEAISLARGAGGPQLKRNPLGGAGGNDLVKSILSTQDFALIQSLRMALESEAIEYSTTPIDLGSVTHTPITMTVVNDSDLVRALEILQTLEGERGPIRRTRWGRRVFILLLIATVLYFWWAYLDRHP